MKLPKMTATLSLAASTQAYTGLEEKLTHNGELTMAALAIVTQATDPNADPKGKGKKEVDDDEYFYESSSDDIDLDDPDAIYGSFKAAPVVPSDSDSLEKYAKKHTACTAVKSKSKKYRGDLYIGVNGGSEQPHFHCFSDGKINLTWGKKKNRTITSGGVINKGLLEEAYDTAKEALGDTWGDDDCMSQIIGTVLAN